MANFVAIYDACVLYPAQLRDLLVRVALSDLFKARWTDMIHDEWIRNLQANRPDIAPGAVCEAVRGMRLALTNPPKSVAELLDDLLRAGLPGTVAHLETMEGLL